MRTLHLMRALGSLAIGALVACGGGSSDSEDAVAATDPASSSTLDFESCLAEQGVEAPEGFGADRPGRGVPPDDAAPPLALDDEMQAAMEACAALAPEGGFPGGGDGAMQAFRECLAEQGVELPDPEAEDPPPAGASGDPAFVAAQRACADLQPTPPSTSTTAPEVEE